MRVTEEIMLRPISTDDTDFVINLSNMPDIKKNFPRSYDLTKEMHLQFLEDFVVTSDKYFIILYNNITVGTISIYDINNTHKHAEFGRFMTHPDYQRKGIGKSVLNKIIEYAFTELDLHRLYCTVLINNDHAHNLYSKIGFKHEGLLNQHFFINDKFVDCYIMGITKGEKNER